MKRCLVIIMPFILLFLTVGLSAQEQAREGRKEYTKTPSKSGLPLSEVGLTEEQNKEIEAISTNYRDTILQLRSKLAVKQVELKSHLRDPEVNEKSIQARAREIRILNVSIHKMMISYQLEIRQVLTPEQIRLWGTLENSSAKRGRRQ